MFTFSNEGLRRVVPLSIQYYLWSLLGVAKEDLQGALQQAFVLIRLSYFRVNNIPINYKRWLFQMTIK